MIEGIEGVRNAKKIQLLTMFHILKLIWDFADLQIFEGFQLSYNYSIYFRVAVHVYLTTLKVASTSGKHLLQSNRKLGIWPTLFAADQQKGTC